MEVRNLLVNLEEMESNIINLENDENVINFDFKASYNYNKFLIESGYNIKIAPIYKDDIFIGVCYVQLQSRISGIRYIIRGGIIFLNGYEDVVEEFIDKNFCCKNVIVRYTLFQQLNFKLLHKIKHLPTTTLIPIKETEQEQRKLLNRLRRRDITKAVKMGLTVRELTSINEWENMLNLLKELADFRGFKCEIDMQLLKTYYEKLLPKRMAVAFACFYEGKMIAADLVFFSKNRADFQIIAEKPEIIDSGAQSYLIWEIIKYCRNNNINYLDLANTPPEYHYMAGIGKFKKSFGGDSLNMQIYEENTILRLKQNLILSPTLVKLERLFKNRKL